MDSTNNRLAMDAVWVRNNVAFLVRYWWTARDALNRVKETPEAFDEFKDNEHGPRFVESVVSGHLANHNYAGVLLAFASFEEFFMVLCAELGALRGVSVDLSDLKDRGVPRFRKYVHKVCRLTTVDLQVDWPFLEQFSIVRNCIVHANGNRGRLAGPTSLDRVVAAHPKELSYEHDVKLVISDAFVSRCFRATEEAPLELIRYMHTLSNNPPQLTSGGHSDVE